MENRIEKKMDNNLETLGAFERIIGMNRFGVEEAESSGKENKKLPGNWGMPSTLGV